MQDAAGIIRIRNWDKWQSYRRDRGQPPWIKVHRCVMRDPEWVALTDAQRGQLVAMWLLAADRDGVIPASPDVIRKLCFMDTEPDLDAFFKMGFLERGVTVASVRRQDDAPEKSRDRVETEEKTARASQLPKTWAPTAEHIERARTLGLDLLAEVEKFRAHAEEHNRKAIVWNGAFTRWLINAAQYAKRNGQPARSAGRGYRDPSADTDWEAEAARINSRG